MRIYEDTTSTEPRMSASKPLMVYGPCVWCQGNVSGHPEKELASQKLIRKIREADNT